MSQEKIRARVQQIVLQLAPNAGVEHAPGLRLIEDLAYHSLAFLELGFALEDELGVPPITREVAMTISTLGDLEAHVLRSVGSGAANLETGSA